MNERSADHCDVLVVGSGPAGLSAAARLLELGVERVTVVEREPEPGGVPRHTDHTGFGVRDLHRVLGGPAYAARLTERAASAGAKIELATTVLEIRAATAEGSIAFVVDTTSAAGRRTRSASAIVLATGVRERPRAARLVPGDRPAGVLTTGSLQQLVAAGIQVGRRAVVVGSEHVSYSAVLTLEGHGCDVVAMIDAHDRHQTSRLLALATTGRHRVPRHGGRSVAEIVGRRRVEAVVLDDATRIACDTVVFTGDWIPDHDLARRSGVVLDRATRGPAVDGALRTTVPGVFAVGNLVHGAETADVCALEGRHVASYVVAALAAGAWPAARPMLVVEAPLRWAAPSLLSPDVTASRGRVLLRTDRPLARRERIVVRQGERELWRGRPHGAAAPNRSCWIPAGWVAQVDPASSVPVVAGVA